MLCAMALLSVRGLVRRPWFDGLELELVAGELRVVHGASGVGSKSGTVSTSEAVLPPTQARPTPRPAPAPRPPPGAARPQSLPRHSP